MLVLLTVGLGKPADSRDERITGVGLEPAGDSETSPEPSRPKRERAKEEPAPPKPAVEEPPPETPEPPPAIEPKAAPTHPTPSEHQPSPTTPRTELRPSHGQAYGPPNSGRPASRDPDQVGTAPHRTPTSSAAGSPQPHIPATPSNQTNP